MKKIFILICLILFSTSIAKAAPSYCAAPKDVGNSLTTGISNVTGMNFLTTKAVELAIQNSIKKELGSNANVEVYPYSVGALTQGKFKKMTINSKSLNVDGLTISDFKAESLCSYNHVEVKGDDIFFKENFGMSFSTKITNNDLAELSKSPEFLKILNQAKVKVLGQTMFSVNYMKMAIKNNKLVIVMKVMSPILWGTEQKMVTATSGLSVINGKITYTNLRIMNVTLADNTNALISLINKLNPFTIEINITKNSSGYTSFKNVIIENNEIAISGNVFVPKNN